MQVMRLATSTLDNSIRFLNTSRCHRPVARAPRGRVASSVISTPLLRLSDREARVDTEHIVGVQTLPVAVGHRMPRVLGAVRQPTYRVGPWPCGGGRIDGKALELQCGSRLAKGSSHKRCLGRLQRDSMRHAPATLEACCHGACGERERGFGPPRTCQRGEGVGSGQAAAASRLVSHERRDEHVILRVDQGSQPLVAVVLGEATLFRHEGSHRMAGQSEDSTPGPQADSEPLHILPLL